MPASCSASAVCGPMAANFFPAVTPAMPRLCASVKKKRTPADEVTISVGEGAAQWGGDASFRTAYGDFYLSQGVDAFPEGSVNVTVTYGGTEHTLAATSVKNEETLSPGEALAKGIAAEKETMERMRKNGVFCGELCVRLLRRDKNYYYFAVTDGTERISLLLDGETGEVLARREDTLRSDLS